MSEDFAKRLREAFDSDSVHLKNIALRKSADRIEQLEAALRLIADHPVDNSQQWQVGCNEMRKVARAALAGEKKDE